MNQMNQKWDHKSWKLKSLMIKEIYLSTNRLKEELIIHSLGRYVVIIVVVSKDE